MTLPAERFSKAVLAGLIEQEREGRLGQLEHLVNQELVGCTELSQFQERLYAMIKNLEGLGFSLGRWEYDCEVEVWGGPSYMDERLEDDLLLRSTFPAGVALAWKNYERLAKKA